MLEYDLGLEAANVQALLDLDGCCLILGLIHPRTDSELGLEWIIKNYDYVRLGKDSLG
jgi:hypothetical protein